MVVEEHHAGQRIDVVLAALFPQYSRTQLTTWLKDGVITVNQRPYKPKEKVMGGECIQLHSLPVLNNTHCEPQDVPLNIVFEDEDLLIINKPAGLVVHPGAGHQDATLVNGLLYHDPELQALPRAGIIHRLDKDTTGLLIVAKHLTSYTQLIRAMQARLIQRCYVALVHGQVIAGQTIQTFYGRHPHQRLKMAVCAHGKEAITQYRVNERLGEFTLLDVQLMTGRTHQIRVHMAHARHPVVGDPLYNPVRVYSTRLPEPVRQALHQFKRQALHACTLSFTHPMKHTELQFSAPRPDDFQELLDIMGANV